MATFKAEIIKAQQRRDGTWNIKIRITHNGEVKRVSTPWYASKDDITRGCKLKNQKLIDACEQVITKYRQRLIELGIGVSKMSINAVVDAITKEANDLIKFFPYAYEQVEKRGAGRGVYLTAVNSFRNFIKDDNIAFQDISSRIVKRWYDSMTKKSKNDSYNALRAIFKDGRREYNDEESKQYAIPNDPFASVVLDKREQGHRQPISVEALRMIYRMKDEKQINSSRNMVRDLIIMSFCMMGTNAADFYDMACKTDNGTIEYERKKTRSRREDNAFISIDINNILLPYIDKYKDAMNVRTFRFYRTYASNHVFNCCIARGIRQVKEELICMYREEHAGSRLKDADICKLLSIECMTFYSVRHAWATIARNDCRIDKYTVHEGLNHVDKDTKITDIYIKKSFKAINDANQKVIEYVFGNTMGGDNIGRQ